MPAIVPTPGPVVQPDFSHLLGSDGVDAVHRVHDSEDGGDQHPRQNGAEPLHFARQEEFTRNTTELRESVVLVLAISTGIGRVLILAREDAGLEPSVSVIADGPECQRGVGG